VKRVPLTDLLAWAALLIACAALDITLARRPAAFDPCLADPDEYAAAEQWEAEIALRTVLAQSGDPLDAYNLVVALADGGYPVEVSWLREVAMRCAPWDEMYPNTLEVLADEVDDPVEASDLREVAQYLKETMLWVGN